jgi:hypothetical protein
MPSLRHNLEVPPKYIEIEKTRQIQGNQKKNAILSSEEQYD